MALFRIAADHGAFYNDQKFGDLRGRIARTLVSHLRIPIADDVLD
jgi:hypothetical protein